MVHYTVGWGLRDGCVGGCCDELEAVFMPLRLEWCKLHCRLCCRWGHHNQRWKRLGVGQNLPEVWGMLAVCVMGDKTQDISI